MLATIASACSIAILIGSPRRELAAQLESDWQEYRQHVGEIPAFPATSKKLQNSLQLTLDTKRTAAKIPTCRTQGAGGETKQGAERWQRSKASLKPLATTAMKTA